MMYNKNNFGQFGKTSRSLLFFKLCFWTCCISQFRGQKRVIVSFILRYFGIMFSVHENLLHSFMFTCS